MNKRGIKITIVAQCRIAIVILYLLNYATGYSEIVLTANLPGNVRFLKSGWNKINNWGTPTESGHYISGVQLDKTAGDFKAPLAGIYLIFASITLSGAVDGQFTIAAIIDQHINHIHGGLSASYQGDPQGSYTLLIKGTVLLTKNGAVSIYAHSAKDTDWTVMGHSQSTFSLQFVSLAGKVPGFSSFLKKSIHIDSPSIMTIREWSTTGVHGVYKSMTGFSDSVGEFSALCEGIYFIAATIGIQAEGDSTFAIWLTVDDKLSGPTIRSTSSKVFTLSLSTVLLLKKGQIVTVKVQRLSGNSKYSVRKESGYFGTMIGKLNELRGGMSSLLVKNESGSSGDWIRLQIKPPTGTTNGQFERASTDLLGGSFSPPVDGVYIVSVTLLVKTSSSIVGALASSYIPASSFSNSIKGIFNINSKQRNVDEISFSVSGLIKLSSRQPLQFYLYTQNSGAYTILNGSRFSFGLVNTGYPSSHFELAGQAPISTDNSWVEIKTWTFNGGLGSYSLSSSQLRPTTGRYAIASDGIYFVSCNIVFEDALGAISLLISVNGEQSKRKGLFSTNGNPVSKETLHAAGSLRMTNGDYVSVFVKAAGSSSWAIGSKSTFSVTFIGLPIFVSGFSTVLSSRVTISSSTWTQLKLWVGTFNAPHFSDEGSFDLATGVYTAPTTGIYVATANLKLQDASLRGSSYLLNVVVNGNPSTFTYFSALTDYVIRDIAPPSANDFFSMNVGGTLHIERGDKVTLWIKGEGDPSWSISEDSSYSIVLVCELPYPFAFAAQAVLDTSISQKVTGASSWKKIRHWKTSKRANEQGPFGINVDLDGADGSYGMAKSGVYLVFGVISLKDAKGTFEAGIYFSSNLGSLYSVYGDSGLSTYTMKLFGLLYVASGQKISIQIRSPKRNWEQDVRYCGWSIVKVPHFEVPLYISAGIKSFHNQSINGSLIYRTIDWQIAESSGQQETGSGLDPVGGSFTVPQNGTYITTAQVLLNAVSFSSMLEMYIGVNGPTSIISRQTVLGPSTFTASCTGSCSMVLTTVFVLSKNDRLGVYLRVNGSKLLSLASGLVSVAYVSPSFPRPNGVFTQLSHSKLITVKGNSQVTGWTTQSVPGAFQGASGNLDDLNILYDGIYYIATNLHFKGFQGQTKSYIALRNIPAVQSVKDNEDDDPFSMLVVGCMKISKNFVFTVTVYSDNDPSYMILKTSSKAAIYIGTLESVWGFAARPTSRYSYLSSKGKWRLLGNWGYTGQSWQFSSRMSLTNSEILDIPRSGTYLFSANIITRLASNASTGVLELLLSVDGDTDVSQHSLYQRTTVTPGRTVTLSFTGQLYAERWSQVRLLLRFEKEAVLSIEVESTYSVVQLDSNIGNVPCQDFGPRMIGQLNPGSIRKGIGSTVEWQCHAAGSSIAYGWRKNYQQLPSATSSKLTLTNLKVSDSGDYVCSVTNNGVRSSSDIAKLTVYDPKPEFLNKLEDYQLTFAENGDERSTLLNISARAQTPSDPYATMKFDIIQGNVDNIFTLIPEFSAFNVSLVRRKSLDRELVSQYNLVIRAINLAGNYIATQQIRITVTDENDNRPSFHPPTYATSIFENATVGTVLLQVVARDQDTELNAKIHFSIPGLLTDIFSVNSTTGVISLMKTLNREERASYVLFVRASDGVYSTFTSVDITVKDINEFQPKFLKTVYNISVAESIEIKTAIFKLDVQDKDIGENARLLFEILEGNTVETFTVREDGYLMNLKQLDYEANKFFTLIVSVSDRGVPSLKAMENATIHVNVKNTNDNSPHFDKSDYQISIAENASIGTKLATVRAIDKESAAKALTYQLEGEDGRFKINVSSGLLTLNTDLDYETQAEYRFFVIVSDNDTPPLTDKALVKVIVTDFNDQRPEFNQSVLVINVTESDETDTEITTVKAIDKDTGINAQIKYEISGGNIDKTFIVDSFSGKLVAVKPLDREKYNSFKITIRAVDLGQPPRFSDPSLLIKIFLRDKNDNAPTFYPPSYVIKVLENVTVGDTILRLNVSDPDAEENGTIVLSIVEPEMRDLFDVDQSSTSLVLKKKLDYEKITSYQFRVLARDNGAVQLQTSATVVVTVVNVNDNRPRFTQVRYRANIPDMALSNVTVIQVIATDPDSGPLGKLTYELVTNAPGDIFSINSDSGVVKTVKDLNTTDVNFYQLKVIAKDSHIPPAVSNITDLIVYITKKPNINTSNRKIGTASIEATISTKGFAGLTVLQYEVIVQEYHPNEEDFNEKSDLPPVYWYTVNVLGSVEKNFMRRYTAISLDIKNNQTRQRRALDNEGNIFVTIGSNPKCSEANMKTRVCNGPLKSGKSYRLQLRAHITDSQFPLDSHFTSPITTGSIDSPVPVVAIEGDGMLGLAVTFCISVLALLLLIIIFVIWKRTHQIINVDHLEEKSDRGKPFTNSKVPSINGDSNLYGEPYSRPYKNGLNGVEGSLWPQMSMAEQSQMFQRSHGILNASYQANGIRSPTRLARGVYNNGAEEDDSWRVSDDETWQNASYHSRISMEERRNRRRRPIRNAAVTRNDVDGASVTSMDSVEENFLNRHRQRVKETDQPPVLLLPSLNKTEDDVESVTQMRAITEESGTEIETRFVNERKNSEAYYNGDSSEYEENL